MPLQLGQQSRVDNGPILQQHSRVQIDSRSIATPQIKALMWDRTALGNVHVLSIEDTNYHIV